MSNNLWDDYDYHMHTGELPEYFDNDKADEDEGHSLYNQNSPNYRKTLKPNPNEPKDSKESSPLYTISITIFIICLIIMILTECNN